MRIARTTLALAGCLGVAMLLGCGGSSPSSGGVNVHLVDGPINGFLEVNLTIQTVEIATPGGWTVLGTPNKTVNLLSLTGGLEEMLASGASLPAGHYSQMRLLLGSGNTIKLADGTLQDLKVPSGLQTGVKFPVSFEVQQGTTEDVFIDFDAAHSIQVVGAGMSGQYLLRPVVRAFDKVVTGSISGTFTDGGVAPQPLVGAMVYAEALDGSGTPTIARSTVTDANGHYTLDLLPVGATYYVVSQPLVGGASYDAKASGPQALTSAAAVLTYNAAFTVDTAVGTVSGGITPVATADQSDAVDLMQSLMAGGSSFTFIVRTAMATVGTSTEDYSFAGVPAGTYSVAGARSTLASDGTTTTSASAAVPATVTNGATATANLTF